MAYSISISFMLDGLKTRYLTELIIGFKETMRKSVTSIEIAAGKIQEV